VKPPANYLVVDAAILIAALRGRSALAIRDAGRVVTLVTSSRAVDEVRRRVELALKRPDLLPALDILIDGMQVVQHDKLVPLLQDAERTLKDSVPSHNGSIKDAHLVVLAWSLDADVWTTDRDFGGTGIASWSTANLVRALQI